MGTANNHMITTWQQGIGASDATQFNQFFRYYYPRLVRFAIHYVHSHEAAEELVSDSFVKIWEKRATIHEIQNLEVYLFVMVKNACLNHNEKFSVVHLQLDADGNTGLFDNTGHGERQLELKELAHRVHMEIERLPEQCRIIFKMVKEDNLKFHEVAEILGISQRTVETQIYRAVKKLKKVLLDSSPTPLTNKDMLLLIGTLFLLSQ